MFSFASKTIEKVNTRIKGSFLEKPANYLKSIYVDYRDVVISVKTDIKEKPVKATFFFTGMGFLTYSLTHNPNEQSFKAKFIECTNQVALVNQNLVNPDIVKHLTFIQKCYNKDLIRYRSFGLFSIIWVDKFSDQCGIYETKCSYLQVPYSEITNRIIDVGFLNIWWHISRKMLDYDINY